MGRPRQSADGGVRKPHPIRFTDAEWDLLCRVAEKHGCSTAALVRRRTLGGADDATLRPSKLPVSLAALLD